jgi:hypothetical protein
MANGSTDNELFNRQRVLCPALVPTTDCKRIRVKNMRYFMGKGRGK